MYHADQIRWQLMLSMEIVGISRILLDQRIRNFILIQRAVGLSSPLIAIL